VRDLSWKVSRLSTLIGFTTAVAPLGTEEEVLIRTVLGALPGGLERSAASLDGWDGRKLLIFTGPRGVGRT
jgi:hypothetical protein